VANKDPRKVARFLAKDEGTREEDTHNTSRPSKVRACVRVHLGVKEDAVPLLG